MAPLVFTPLYMQRVWGGRSLESEYGRTLPDDAPYGESWEIVDREDHQSVVARGPLTGSSLHELWITRRDEIFGRDLPESPRFPLLIKVLDARDDLSIQVHPPAAVAPQLGGEPKTEMWYIAKAEPGAKLYVGLKKHTTRAAFESAIQNGRVADLVHAVTPSAGESIFIPSGRLHAIGAGLLIHEIQQNSDTTYRVFDWNRTGLDGKPRDLHLDASLRSINFDDYEPGMDKPENGILADCQHFRVEKLELKTGTTFSNARADRFSIISVAHGRVQTPNRRVFNKGDFFLLPVGSPACTACENSVIVRTTIS